jgi:hypothetical protein
MKKILTFGLVLMLIFAGSAFAAISCSDSNTETKLSGSHMILVNDGADEVYITLQNRVATTSDFELQSGEAIAIDSDAEFEEINCICDTAETASVRLLQWK